MTGVEMWHNQSCSKSRAAQSALDEAGVPYRLRPYLDQPPTAQELADVLARLGAQPWDICRTNEPVAAELGLADWPRDASDEANVRRWIDAMVAHPRLIQRPILLVDGGEAVVGRSPEVVDTVLSRWRP